MSAHPSLALVVEDHPQTRAFLVDLLERSFGARVKAFETLRASLRWLEAGAPNEPPAPLGLALVDLGLPDGSGLELVRALGRLQPGAIPVVVTIFDDDAHLFDAIAAGAQGYLLKSEPAEVLASTLRRIERGEPPLSPAIARRMLAHFRHPERSGPRAPVVDRAAAVGLTAREEQVLGLLGKGLRVTDVAQALAVTENTVSGYVKALYRKLDIGSRAEAALEAAKRGLL